MKIKINDKEIELTPEQIKILKEEVNSEKKGLWKPKGGEKYACIDTEGAIFNDTWRGDELDEKRYSIGNVYKTTEEAQAHRNKLKAIQRVKEYIAENCEVVEDLENIKTLKWHVTYSLLDNKFSSSWDQLTLDSYALPYLKTETDAYKVRENCGADLKVILGIK